MVTDISARINCKHQIRFTHAEVSAAVHSALFVLLNSMSDELSIVICNCLNAGNAWIKYGCQLQVETEEVKASLSEIFKKWAR